MTPPVGRSPQPNEKDRMFSVFEKQQAPGSSEVKKLGQVFETAGKSPFLTTPTSHKRGANHMDISPTPPLSTAKRMTIMGTDDAATALLQEIRSMRTKLTQVHDKVNSTYDATQEIKEEMGLLKSQVSTLQTTVDEQAKQIRFLQVENDRLHVEAKRQYVVIHGIQETERNPAELHSAIDQIFFQGLKMDSVSYDNPKRIPQYPKHPINPAKPRPVSVFFQWPSEREEVLRAAKRERLRGIYINPDLPTTLRAEAQERRLREREQRQRPPNPQK